MDTLCKFHQSGHCKFASSCKHFHTTHTCTNLQCDQTTCRARHPRPCTYYSRFGHCKFGTSCSYLHDTIKETEIEKLKKDLDHVMILLKVKENEMKDLEKKVDMMKDQINKSPCDHCDSNDTPATSATKHMENTHQSEEVNNFRCNFGGCRYTARTKTILKRHMTMKHKLDSNFVYPSSAEKFQCDECTHEFFLDNTFAIHTYNEHQKGFSCGHCKKNLPGDVDMLEIHYNHCTFPCGGDPLCPC